MESLNEKIASELEEAGYTQRLSLTVRELDILRKSIDSQWMATLSRETTLNFGLERNTGDLSIKDYHRVADQVPHKRLWTKENRILPRQFVDWFLKESQFYQNIEGMFKEAVITDEEHLGYGNIYWRLVRPNQESDIGPLHRDAWFWEANESYVVEEYKNYQRIKVWIAICVEEGKNGLLVEPKSHKRRDIEWEPEIRDGKAKPKLLTDVEKLNPMLLNCKSGDAVIFDDNLIHGGALNIGSETRVSVEFTIARPINS